MRQRQLVAVAAAQLDDRLHPLFPDELVQCCCLEPRELTVRPGSRVQAGAIAPAPIIGARLGQDAEQYLPCSTDNFHRATFASMKIRALRYRPTTGRWESGCRRRRTL